MDQKITRVDKYKCLLFDWDGTLADTVNLWLKSYKSVLSSKYNVEVSEKEIKRKAYGDPKGVLAFGVKNYQQFNNELFAIVETSYPYIPLFPEVKETLMTLVKRGKFNMALVTSTKRSMLMRALEYHKLVDIFSIIVTADEVKNVKPHPESLKIIISSVKCDKNKTLIIGDSDKDILAGIRSGIKTALFIPNNRAGSDTDEIKQLLKLKPTHVIHSHNELLSLTAN